MENLLEQTTFDRENYKAQLSGNDGRISALESQIARIEASKNDSEFKLSSLYSILRRSLGLRSHSRPPTPNEGSPKKNRRSFRGRSRSSSGKPSLNFTCMALLATLVQNYLAVVEKNTPTRGRTHCSSAPFPVLFHSSQLSTFCESKMVTKHSNDHHSPTNCLHCRLEHM